MWSHSFNVDYHDNLWFADKNNSAVIYLSKEDATWNALFKVSGGSAGYRDGNLNKAIFNSTTSICVHDLNITKVLLARSI